MFNYDLQADIQNNSSDLKFKIDLKSILSSNFSRIYAKQASTNLYIKFDNASCQIP